MAVTGIPRSQITQVFQLGAESIGTPGTGGTPNQRLGTFNSQIAPVASGAFGVFRPSGGKYVGQIVPTDIYAEGAYTDSVDYNTIPFQLSGNVGWVLATSDSGTPAATTWRHTPVPFGPGTQRSYAVEEGDPGRGSHHGAVYPYNNVVTPDLSLRFMRTGASQMTGRILGRVLPPKDAMTTVANFWRGHAVSSLTIGVWEAPDWATLIGSSATRLAPVALDLSWRHNGVFAPWFALDDSIISFAGTLEEAVDSGVQISVMADVANGGTDISGMFNYSNMDNGADLYLKVLTTGILIHGSVPYMMEIDMHLIISGPPRRANVGSVRVWQWDALLMPDTVTPFLPFDITVVNTLPPSAIPNIT